MSLTGLGPGCAGARSLFEPWFQQHDLAEHPRHHVGGQRHRTKSCLGRLGIYLQRGMIQEHG